MRRCGAFRHSGPNLVEVLVFQMKTKFRLQRAMLNALATSCGGSVVTIGFADPVFLKSLYMRLLAPMHLHHGQLA